MKKSFFALGNCLFLTMLFGAAQCKKEQALSNITLYDKSLSVIRQYVQGKWKCHYGKGGIAANMVQYYDNYYWTFSSNDRVLQSYNGAIVTDTTIKWVWARGTWTNGDSTFLMIFYDKQGYPHDYIVDKILNDTLVLHDNAADAVFYHFTKF